MKRPFVSVVLPVYNEERNLPGFLASYAKLRYPASARELIVVDGGSTDRTVSIAKQAHARVIGNPGKIRSTGCEAGVGAAHGELIAFTDADCTVPPDWIDGLVRHMKNGVSAVGGPNVTPHNDTPFAKAAGSVLAVLTGPGSRYGYRGKDVTPIYHNPGCNVLYRKSAILSAGGFDARLLTCEDEELDFRIRENGGVLLFTPDVVVDHYRRPTYERFFIQFYRYAIGRIQAIALHPHMARWFHFVPLAVFVSGITVLAVLGAAGRIDMVLMSVVTGGLVCASFMIFLAVRDGYLKPQVYLLLFAAWYSGWTLGTVAGLLRVLTRPVSAIQTGMTKKATVRR